MNQTDTYAHALYIASQEKNSQEFDNFFDNFVALVKKKNHYMLLPHILKKVQTLEESNTSGNQTVLVLSDKKHQEKYKKELARYEALTQDVIVKEDPNIVGGYIAKNRTTMVDNSYRTRLLKLYQTLVA